MATTVAGSELTKVNNNNNNNNMIHSDAVNSNSASTSPTTNTAPSILTIRMIMQGKEVGSIIGKKGDNIKKFREESGAKINISDGSCPERIVTVTGSIETIFKAFTMISKKFEEDLQNVPTTPKPPVTLRLVMPASQCGSLIGKQGCKIKEIRESTGASIQVASEMLPNSTERAVTVSGTAEAITQCIKYICGIMQESPPKGANLPYRPKPVVSPVFVSGGQQYSVQPQMTLASQDPMKQLPPHMTMAPHPMPMIPTAQTILPGGYVPVNGLTTRMPMPRHAAPTIITPGFHIPTSVQSMPWKEQMQGFHIPTSVQSMPWKEQMQGMTHIQYPRHANPAQAQPLPAGQATHEMAIPNDLIGCIIGRGGQKINEIRQVSGANIKISNAEDGSADRKVTITGTPDTIGLAQYLISTSMELHKALTLVDPTSNPPVTSTSMTQMAHPAQPQHSHPAPMAIPMQPMTMKPATAPITYFSSYNPMGFVDHAQSAAAHAAHAAGAMAVDRKALTTKLRVGMTANALKAAERPKFAPY
ncbi:poly(rC)-binding protein 3-like isoform X2 [Littorina saxatilis]|uniref:poly(rC)-binding protein 3-like isoform X2 n=1 Tax=Littorina saxatilis TaxID=31220 RepID=UPI0038B66E01